ncbi:DUF3168 domain-containing protein [Melaminivora sp.]|uniref:tail completion protein gp17 n=1 Tax=Melaminivora sp. TaxID=1933032 RepID=UPI0028A87813|nr:DUF3168 domain-containing protein [Melaminivora sp.]
MTAPQAPKIIVALLKADAALLAVVPVARMYPGTIPQGAVFPALAYTNISDNDRHTISGDESTVIETGRVQVTVAAKDYPTKERLIGLVRNACADKRGQVAGITVNNVRSAGIGPDLDNADAGIFGRTIDFLVTSRRARA